MKTLLPVVLLILSFISCQSSNNSTPDIVLEYSYEYGHGIYNPKTITFDDTLVNSMFINGASIFNKKCASCHTLSREKFVGPGLENITRRRTYYWIMNFISNPKPMIDKDTTLHKLVQLCLVEMPNVKLEENEVREILELFRFLDNERSQDTSVKQMFYNNK